MTDLVTIVKNSHPEAYVQKTLFIPIAVTLLLSACGSKGGFAPVNPRPSPTPSAAASPTPAPVAASASQPQPQTAPQTTPQTAPQATTQTTSQTTPQPTTAPDAAVAAPPTVTISNTAPLTPSTADSGKRTSPPPAPPAAEPPQIHKIDLPPEHQDKAIANASIGCEKNDPDSCPSAVGMLVSRTDHDLGVCTAFLVGPKTLLTNSHCIPDDLKAHPEADCSAKLQVFFPAADGFAAERASCAKVLSFSKIVIQGENELGENPDDAVIELTSAVKRRPLEIDREGISNGLRLRAFSVDPQSNTAVVGLLKMKTCTARYGSLLTPSFVQPLAPQVTLDGCTIIPGNSGSPAIADDGRVRAIMHGFTKPSQAVVTHANDFGKDLTINVGALSLATNLACVDLPSEVGAQAGPAARDCQKTVTKEQLMSAGMKNANIQLAATKAKDWIKNAPPVAQFELTEASLSGAATDVFAPQITCITDADKALKTTFTLPFWGIEPTLDADYRIQTAVREEEELSLQLSYDAGALKHAGQINATATVHSRRSGLTKSIHSYPVKLCKSK